MKKKLNLSKIDEKRNQLGLNQRQIADKVGVTRECISQWLKNESFPRPDKLLKLASMLKLNYKDLVLTEPNKFEPIVAFRTKANVKTKPKHIDHAKDIALGLEKLVPFLEFERFKKPGYLINPEINCEYIKNLVIEFKKDYKISQEKIEIEDITKIYNSYKAILVPVSWGDDSINQHALHIILPKSWTTWVLLNLDAKIHDFKFWMLHELGHIISNGTQNSESERFADLFAQEFLFDSSNTQKLVTEGFNCNNKSEAIAKVISRSRELNISPYTIYKQIESLFPDNCPIAKNEIGKILGGLSNQQTFAETISLGSNSTAEYYIETICNKFDNTFFNTLLKARNEDFLTPEYLKRILNIQIFDANSICEYLLGTKSNSYRL